ncbi:MAG: FAD-dependent oxidoreductase [Brevinematales bacterium]|nr:FAD-dependent oxidoreductase [Brevinematales bacterium]
MTKARYLTIGYSAGAIGMIEAIRQYDKDGTILALTKEPYVAYGRPAIVDYAMGKIDEEGIFYRGSVYSTLKKVTVRTGAEVVAINAKSKTVKLATGEEIGYEYLLINTGGKPISPPMPGKELEGVMHFFTLDEAKKMRQQVLERGARRAVVIGGGLIGLKATEALVHLGVEVVMVELAPIILGRALDPVSSRLMAEKMQKHGVRIYTNASVTEILGDTRVRQVKLSTGEVIDTDLVYISIGVTPESKLAEDAGITVNRGIEVNRYMQTNLRDIYAAGDVAKGYNFLTKENMVIAIWPVARKMGYFAGLSMVGKPLEYDGSIPMNSLYFEDLYTISYGETNPQNPSEYEILEKLYDDGVTYRKFVIKDNRIMGAVFVNDITRAGIVKGLIYEDVPVSKYKDKLLRRDFSFVDLPKSYRSFVYGKPFKELLAKE